MTSLLERFTNNNYTKISEHNNNSNNNHKATSISIPATPLNLTNKNMLTINDVKGTNKTMARSIDIDFKNSLRNRNQTRLTRPIALVKQHQQELNNLEIENDLEKTLNLSNSSNKIKIRLLVFVEDSDGIRSNIFDSAKQSGSTLNSNQLINNTKELKKLSKSVMNNKLNGKLNNEPSSLPSSKIPINRLINNNNISNNSSNATTSSNKLTHEVITRMVFGSFPMLVSNRTAIKVHSLKSTNKTMISNVFTYYNNNHFSNTKNSTLNCYCNNKSSSSNNNIAGSIPISNSSKIPKTNCKIVTSTEPSSPVDHIKPSDMTKKPDILSSESSSFNSTSNLYLMMNNNMNNKTNSNANINMLGSSVPTSSICGGSYAGMYKRFMRSISNSLISSNSNLTATNNTNNGETLHNEFLNTTTNENSNSNKQNLESSFTSANNEPDNVSMSGGSTNNNHQSFLCEKCVENNLYPKYKVGVAILFCLPQESNINSNHNTPNNNNNNNNNNNSNQHVINSNSGTPPPPFHMSPSASCSNNGLFMSEATTPSHSNLCSIPFVNSAHVGKSQNNGSGVGKMFDQIALFPATSSSSNSPTSPPNSPNSVSSMLQSNNLGVISKRGDVANGSGVKAVNESASLNEDFYEFFFSHLPIIEYQFKEMREKIINYLPYYFSSPKYQNHLHQHSYNHHQHRHSITSQASNNSNLSGSGLAQHSTTSGKSTNYSSLNSSTVNLLTSLNEQKVHLPQIQVLSFSKHMINEIESFERKFNLLYNSPRLTCPAWLSLINTKTYNQQNNSNKANIINISNNLINEFNHLSKIVETPILNKTLSQTPKTSEYFNQIFQNIKNSFTNSTSLTHSQSYTNGFSISSNNNNNNNMNTSILGNTDSSSSNSSSLFLSTMLSTILKHHLSWVYTVLPSNEMTESTDNNSTKTSSLKTKLRKQRANWTSILEKSNPYNPLWAVLSDLHGSVNQPLKLVRTVVVGQNRELVESILFFLSYFIRCGNSSYFDIIQENFDFNKLVNPLLDLNQLTTAQQTTTTTESNSSDMSREINITDLKYDHMSQLSVILSNKNNETNENGKVISNKRQKDIVDSRNKNRSSVSTASSLSPPITNTTNTTNTSSSSSSSPFNTLPSSKKRHVSSSSNGVNCNAQELPLIGFKLRQNYQKSTRMQDNFGYSLLANYCDEFVFEFVLHGTSDRSFLPDLQQKIQFSKNNSILDCPIDESVYIVVDLDQVEIKVFSSDVSKPVIKEKPVPIIDNLLQSILNMIKLFQNSEFVLLHLEDKLQELYTKSITLNQLKSQSHQIEDSTLMQLMEIDDPLDLDFLKRVLSAVKIPNLF